MGKVWTQAVERGLCTVAGSFSADATGADLSGGDAYGAGWTAEYVSTGTYDITITGTNVYKVVAVSAAVSSGGTATARIVSHKLWATARNVVRLIIMNTSAAATKLEYQERLEFIIDVDTSAG